MKTNEITTLFLRLAAPRAGRVFPALLALVLLQGCGSGAAKKNPDFFTSGSREADQRADQRMAKDQQLKGSSKSVSGTPQANEKRPLYQRLGEEDGINAIVDDFITRAMADPRVNWNRKGITQGGFNLHRNQSVEWKPGAADIKMLKTHMVQFLSLATGGPAKYQGKEMKQAHAGMHITNPEFDAAVGDMKATLDTLRIPNMEQKELLSIVESTRQQVVEER